METQTTFNHRKWYNFKSITLGIFFLFSVYSPAQNIESILNETWENGAWENSSQTLNTFDSSNFLTNTLTQSWIAPSGPWENAYQVNYSNNPNGTVNQYVAQSWNIGTSSWENTLRSTYTYNSTNKVLTIVSEIWLGNWQNYLKQTNTYDGNDYLTHYLSQSWDLVSSDWKNSTQTNYANNSNGTVNQSISQIWDVTNVWINFDRSTFTYSLSKKVLTAISESWTGVAWLNDTRVTNTYDGNDFLTLSLSQDWEVFTGSWINESQLLFTNNTEGNPTQIVGQNWDTATSLWNNSIRITFTYSLGVTDFSTAKRLILFPNPATDFISVKTNSPLYNEHYSITDQLGRKVQTGQFFDETATIDISQLNAGIYFFRIGNQMQSIKMIKR